MFPLKLAAVLRLLPSALARLLGGGQGAHRSNVGDFRSLVQRPHGGQELRHLVCTAPSYGRTVGEKRLHELPERGTPRPHQRDLGEQGQQFLRLTDRNEDGEIVVGQLHGHVQVEWRESKATPPQKTPQPGDELRRRSVILLDGVDYLIVYNVPHRDVGPRVLRQSHEGGNHARLRAFHSGDELPLQHRVTVQEAQNRQVIVPDGHALPAGAREEGQGLGVVSQACRDGGKHAGVVETERLVCDGIVHVNQRSDRDDKSGVSRFIANVKGSLLLTLNNKQTYR